ncbi:hypothetical protein BSK56_09620 [Paenibacillus borealis]|uniref:Uncharacterized protein n=1 Tax=Paenibacillus borealis TaxID=160799 RepID=A0ABX3HIF8_PAEBO|nr:hypothetical protein BSK56_09620 [Paenibacillus borealis]
MYIYISGKPIKYAFRSSIIAQSAGKSGAVGLSVDIAVQSAVIIKLHADAERGREEKRREEKRREEKNRVK